MNPSNQNLPSQATFAWIIWGALTMGMFILQYMVGAGFTFSESTGEADLIFVIASLVNCVASTFIRWAVIPKQDTGVEMMQMMIIGCALAESSVILSAIMDGSSDPGMQVQLFTISLVTLLQFAPVYIKD